LATLARLLKLLSSLLQEELLARLQELVKGKAERRIVYHQKDDASGK
jgi:hypothetical protein